MQPSEFPWKEQPCRPPLSQALLPTPLCQQPCRGPDSGYRAWRFRRMEPQPPWLGALPCRPTLLGRLWISPEQGLGGYLVENHLAQGRQNSEHVGVSWWRAKLMLALATPRFGSGVSKLDGKRHFSLHPGREPCCLHVESFPRLLAQ